jgi:WD40 repeat protein
MNHLRNKKSPNTLIQYDDLNQLAKVQDANLEGLGMTPEEALVLLDSLLPGQKLKDIQELVFLYSWQGWTYSKIADHAGYDIGHIRDVGSKLWQQLSQAFGEQVTKNNIQAALRRRIVQSTAQLETPLESQLHDSLIASASALPQRSRQKPTNPHQHWDESLDVPVFYGRSHELTVLEQWILDDQCRLIALLGMGGMGKTTLAIKLAEGLHDQFEQMIWQSLRHAPPIEEVLTHWLNLLSHSESAIPISLEAQLNQLMEYLRQSRCLLVLDNAETILHSAVNTSEGEQTGQYRPGYEAYGELFRRVGVERHASCLVLTSREKPKTLEALEGETLPVRTLALCGLGLQAVQAIVTTQGCSCESEAEWQRLRERYAGNPLALKIVSTTVKDLFDGDVSQFLEQETIAFGDITTLLNEQFQRLSDPEKQVIYWLAINREWMSIADLRSDMPVLNQSKLLEALQSLRRRSLIEQTSGQFTLQPVVMEYVTDRFIEQIAEEIQTKTIRLLISHALIKAQAKDYIRDSQIRLILAPLASRLLEHWRSPQAVQQQLDQLLLKLKTDYATFAGYGGGNVINLLRQLGVELNGYDFSELSIWQAYLQNINLHDVNFTNADLSKSVFTETLATPSAVAFSSNGQIVATGDLNGEVRLWRSSDGKNLLTLKGHHSWVWSLAFSPDGQTLASASDDRTLKLWDLSTGHCRYSLTGHSGSVWSIAYSQDGQYFASGSEDQTVKVWNAHTGECLKTLTGHSNWVRSVAFCPTAPLLASAGDDETIKLWNLVTGRCEQTLRGHSDRVWSIAFAPNPHAAKGHLLVSGSSDNTVRVWQWRTGHCLHQMRGHANWVRSVAFSPDGETVASGSEDHTLRLWHAPSGQCLRTLKGHANWVRSVAFSPDGETVASGSGDHSAKLWDVSTGRCRRTLKGYTNRVWSVAISPDGTTIASGNDDYTIRLWNRQDAQNDRVLRGHSNAVCAIAFSPTAPLLASGSSDHTLKLWDLSTGQCVQTLRGHSSRIWSVVFSSDGQTIATGSDDHTLKLWNVSTGQCVQTLRGHTSWVCGVALNPNPTYQHLVASASYDQTVNLWDSRTGECLQTFQGHTNWVWSTAFSPDGAILASGSGDHTIKLWQVESGDCLQTLQGHTSRIWSIAFCPPAASGSHLPLLASGSSDQTVRLWNWKTGECYQTLQGHSSLVWSVAFSADGRWLVSGSQDETVRLWEVETGECVHVLRAERPYNRMNIAGVSGLTDAQLATLYTLGAMVG